MNIGQIAVATGLPSKTIRYYEEIGLIQPTRAANGYRSFTERHAHTLRFLGRARTLGFSIEECRKLLSLYDDPTRASGDVKKIARDHLDQIAAKIDDLRAMQATLANLIDSCAGDHRPDCPILRDLSES